MNVLSFFKLENVYLSAIIGKWCTLANCIWECFKAATHTFNLSFYCIFVCLFLCLRLSAPGAFLNGLRTVFSKSQQMDSNPESPRGIPLYAQYRVNPLPRIWLDFLPIDIIYICIIYLSYNTNHIQPGWWPPLRCAYYCATDVVVLTACLLRCTALQYLIQIEKEKKLFLHNSNTLD